MVIAIECGHVDRLWLEPDLSLLMTHRCLPVEGIVSVNKE